MDSDVTQRPEEQGPKLLEGLLKGLHVTEFERDVTGRPEEQDPDLVESH